MAGALNEREAAPQIDILRLGVLHEAVFTFSRKQSLEDYWGSVATSVRWVVPAKRISILRRTSERGFCVVARAQGGRLLPPVPGEFAVGSDAVRAALCGARPQWLEDPWGQLPPTDEFREWLASEGPDFAHCVPLVASQKTRGVIVFEVPAPGTVAERAQTTALLTLYVRHASTSAAVLEANSELLSKNRELEQAQENLVSAADEIRLLNTTLEQRIEARTFELQEAQMELLEVSRRAGMADVASGVLHNVGNALTSVNITCDLMGEGIRASALDRLPRALKLFRDNLGSLDEFLTRDDKGQKLLPYLEGLAERLSAEQEELRSQAESLREGLDHIKTIVSAQQSHALSSGLIRVVDPGQLLDEAVKLAGVDFAALSIDLCRDYAPIGDVAIDRHKTMEILLNLLSNASHALEDHAGERRITLRVGEIDEQRFFCEIIDTGAGISQDNLARVFTHGFTTKPGGHGFGLHTSANAATEMGGTLACDSAGEGCGASFVLRLPKKQKASRTAA